MDRRTFLAGIPLLIGTGILASESGVKKKMNTPNTQRMPALYLSHGSPMNVIMDNAFSQDMKKLAPTLPKPKAILMVSAHWMTYGFAVSTEDKPETIHDFYGFPDELYLMEYEAKGAPEIAQKAADLANLRTDSTRGLDHGAWSVLHYLFPERDVPVFQLSIDVRGTYQGHYDLGNHLSALRDQGVMIMGSGTVTHNLRDFRRDMNAPVESWTAEFGERFKTHLFEAPQNLADPERFLPHYAHAHPTADHYLPILPVVGSKREDEAIRIIHTSVQHGTQDMTSFMIG